MENYSSGIYKLDTVINSNLLWHKDNSPAIPFKYEYSQLFFNQIDRIALAEGETPKSLIGLCAVYIDAEKHYLDYGHWELLMTLMLFSMLAEKVQDPDLKEKIVNVYLKKDNLSRINWKHIDSFYQNELLQLRLTDFVKKPDEELSAIEKVLREVAEAVWEYTNCISINNDEEIMTLINNLLAKAMFMVIIGGNSDESLSVAASMYGSFSKLIATDLENLPPEWNFF